jgi:hypothetical protein
VCGCGWERVWLWGNVACTLLKVSVVGMISVGALRHSVWCGACSQSLAPCRPALSLGVTALATVGWAAADGRPAGAAAICHLCSVRAELCRAVLAAEGPVDVALRVEGDKSPYSGVSESIWLGCLFACLAVCQPARLPA